MSVIRPSQEDIAKNPTAIGPYWAVIRWGHDVNRYRVARVIHADGHWFELYWHQDNDKFASTSYVRTRKAARDYGLGLFIGLFTTPPSPHIAGMILPAD